ncbi:hypothetical protein MMC22_008360, partial [Lobaria immixta]|nr:hypothetical protein [Lobaria immixta]
MSRTGRAMEVNEDEERRIATTRTKNLEHTSGSAFMDHEVEYDGQTPLLPPTYSDATAGEVHTPPKAKNPTSSSTTDAKKDVKEPPFVLKLMTILIFLGFTVYAIRSIYYRNVCTPPRHEMKYKTTSEFPEPSEFSLIQKVQGESNDHIKSSRGYVRTEGEIHVRPATENLNSNLRVDITICTSNYKLTRVESGKKNNSTLVIETLNHIKGAQDGHRPYVYIDATIFIAPGTVLRNFGIDSQSLAIIFHPGLDFTVKDRTTLFTISNPIRMPAGSSELLTTTRTREIIVHSSSGSVTGAYPLYDLLSITTLSGSIDISYFPKNSSRLNPKPASLVLSTRSASIQVTSPVIPSGQVIPNRDYKNDLSASSGSITATLLHSSRTSLHAASGHILATIHPHGNLSSPSHLSTDNKSGSTSVTVHNSLSHPSAPMRALSASHHYISGSLKLFYPSQWQGRIFGDTVSGSLNIFWDGVTVVKDHPKWSGGRKIEAER